MRVVSNVDRYCVALFAASLVAISCGCKFEKPVEDIPASQVFEIRDWGTICAQSLAFSPDSHLLAVGLAGPLGCGDLQGAALAEDCREKRYRLKFKATTQKTNGAVYVLDLDSDEKVVAGIMLPKWANSLAFSPDGATLVVGMGDLGLHPVAGPMYWNSEYPSICPSTGQVIFWDTKTWQKTGELELPGAVVAIAIAPSGKWLATMSAKASAKRGVEVTIVDLPGRTKRCGFALDGYCLTPAISGPSQPLAFSPDSSFLAAIETQWYEVDPAKADRDPANVIVWSVNRDAVSKKLVVGPSPATSVGFSEDGQYLTVAADEGFAVWGTKAWKHERRDICHGVLGPLCEDSPLYLKPAWRWIEGARCEIISCQDGKEKLAASLLSTTTRPDYFGGTQVLAVSPDKKSLAAAGTGDEVCVWKMPDLSKYKNPRARR